MCVAYFPEVQIDPSIQISLESFINETPLGVFQLYLETLDNSDQINPRITQQDFHNFCTTNDIFSRGTNTVILDLFTDLHLQTNTDALGNSYVLDNLGRFFSQTNWEEKTFKLCNNFLYLYSVGQKQNMMILLLNIRSACLRELSSRCPDDSPLKVISQTLSEKLISTVETDRYRLASTLAKQFDLLT